MATENTQKGNPPTCGRAHPQPVCVATHNPVLQAIAVVVILAKAALFSLHATKAGNHIRF